ncbi:MAG TPA: hypothetical protein VHG93_14520 [Longimicrobium sp.]|nr:hypothetical protein [Longimicrobium sp.]
MRPTLRLISTSLSVLALSAVAPPARAQECVGLPGGRGVLSLGLEGTDGASGPGVSFAYQTPGASVQLQHRSLDAFAQSDEISESEVQAAVRLPRSRLPLCVTAGVQWTDYEYSEHAGSSWSTTDRLRTDNYEILGGYQRLRVPVGISLGRELELGRGVSVVPYIQPTVVWERERLTPGGQAAETRMGLGWGVNTGVAVAKDWFVMRANFTHTSTYDRALSSRNNFPGLSVHFGVRF